MRRGQDWTVLDSALTLLCQGFSYAETASILGRCRKTIGNWVRGLRKNPERIPEWLTRLRESARRRALTRGRHDA
jgi:transposase